ncbi:MAG TPA: PEP-CTERM sorting domain-containing protein [Nitrospiraceae bacterium]|nr:PEP-CTERM sorting domain-containing protein [Nitrospiraceae bacterium]
MRRKILQIFSFCFLMLFLNTEAMAITIPIDPLQTYLFTNNDPWSGNGSVPGTTPIVLSEFGISGGDLIQLERLGDWYDGHAGYDGDVSAMDVVKEMIGVFSNSTTLLAPNIFSRVPGALDAGVDITTWNTLFGSMGTDIAEDFGIENTFLQVPVGATHLFVAAHDIYYSDNSDPDRDFAVRITPIASVPEPSTLLLLALGFISLTLYLHRLATD